MHTRTSHAAAMRVDKDTRSCVDMVEDTDEEEEIVGNIGCTGHWATLRRVTGACLGHAYLPRLALSCSLVRKTQ
jgi:hypothetical protein